MKNSLKRSTTLLVVMVMLLSIILITPAFAADAKTVQIKGYLREGMTTEQISSAKAQLEIASVSEFKLGEAVKISTTFESAPTVMTTGKQLDGAFIGYSPVTIKNIDEGIIFDVYKLNNDGTNYTYDYKKILPFTSGKVKLYGEDVKAVDVSEMKNYAFDMVSFLPGCTITLTEPGDYYVIFRYEAEDGQAEAFIRVEERPATTPAPAPAPTSALVATPTASKVLVNGKITSFEAYTINGNNYFKLRDLAKVVNGTKKQFEVSWDGSKKAINLISNKPYTAIGGELAKGDGTAKTPVLNTSKLYKDSKEINLTAYTINGNNYFKLRDIAQVFNIGITWDAATSTIGINTNIGYVAQ